MEASDPPRVSSPSLLSKGIDGLRKAKPPLSFLPFERNSLEETIGEIDHYLQQNINYNQQKYSMFMKLSDLINSGNIRNLKAEFARLSGATDREELKSTIYINDLIGIKIIIESYDTILYNAMTLRRDLYENIEGTINILATL
jgi:hypothetical protein